MFYIQLCHVYLSTGTCAHGPRCKFVHHWPPVQPLENKLHPVDGLDGYLGLNDFSAPNSSLNSSLSFIRGPRSPRSILSARSPSPRPGLDISGSHLETLWGDANFPVLAGQLLDTQVKPYFCCQQNLGALETCKDQLLNVGDQVRSA